MWCQKMTGLKVDAIKIHFEVNISDSVVLFLKPYSIWHVTFCGST